jgi:hypothetical protein
MLGRKYAGTSLIALKVQGEAGGVSICGGAVVIGADSVWVGLNGGGSACAGVCVGGNNSASVGEGDPVGKLQPSKSKVKMVRKTIDRVFNIVIPLQW